MDSTATAAHESARTLTEDILYPEHPARKGESAEFRKAVQRLHADGHGVCFVCGATADLQAHHVFCEWSLAPDADFGKLKALAERFDPYGYGKLLTNLPVASVDDIRNLLLLCRSHHTSARTGVHETTMPAWIAQVIARDGVEIIPHDHAHEEEETPEMIDTPCGQGKLDN